MTVFFLDLPVEEEPEPESQDLPVSQPPASARVSSTRSAREDAPSQEPTQEESTAPTLIPRQDWEEQARVVAEAITRRAEAESQRRSFGFPRRREQGGEPEEPGVFEKPPGKAGLIEEFEDGTVRQWVSDWCYRDFLREGPTVPDLIPKVVPVTCKRRGRPRGDLFEHLKPDYLRAPLPGETKPP